MSNVDIGYLSLAHVVQLGELSSVKITIIAECTPIPTGRVTAMHGIVMVFVQDAFQVFNLPGNMEL